MQEKNRLTSGADESTPSIPQYFSWINNTNEGSTEEQTLVNLDYFKWLADRYGMKLKIYAWDAGNLDGSSGTYGFPGETEKLLRQYPNGYKPLADAAAEFGCRLGVWGGADGFGDTPESERKRYDLIVGLCRDLGFMLFKFDTVCGALREEKRATFKRMIDECRRYVPDLVVLNHRNDLGDAEICATTFLWGGVETYIDVHIHNRTTGSHHRVCTLERGLVPEMKRLTEDHGVCLSSCLDFFEDDLIMQAFARSLILAPEIYGNPWLLRDDEQARLARIYNLHEKYNSLLVNGQNLPESYGKNAVTRGDGSTRLIVLNNPTWEKKKIALTVGGEIGLEGEDRRFVVKTLHPYESYAGTFAYGEKTETEIEPFRAALILVEDEEKFAAEDFVLTNVRYETLYRVGENGAEPEKALIYAGNGNEITSVGGRNVRADGVAADHTVKAPLRLGVMTDAPLPANAEQLYEATAFAADSDSLEAQSRKRSGPTAVLQVQRARDAFFAQETYRYRGTESRFLFDGDPDTYFDGVSRYYGKRLSGGCLRVDFGKTLEAARIELEFFAVDTPIFEVPEQQIPDSGTFSADLSDWHDAPLTAVSVTKEQESAPVVKNSVHNIVRCAGKRQTAVYRIGGGMRYFRLPLPMDRIYRLTVYAADGSDVTPVSPKANNMLAPYAAKKFIRAQSVSVTVPESAEEGSYLAAAVNGVHGTEGAYVAAEWEDVPVGCPDRAPSFPVNQWEHFVCTEESGYTYYIPVTPELRGKTVTVTALLETEADLLCEVWLCDGNRKQPAAVLPLQ